MSVHQEQNSTTMSQSRQVLEKEVTPNALSAPPDGGTDAWMTVAGVFLAAFAAFGIGQTWGIFQSAYTTHIASPFYDIGPFNLGFVGGCAIGFGFLMGPFGNILVGSFGLRVPIILGFGLMSLGLMLASISTRYWQLILSQGIMYGLGASLAYIPAIGLPSQWFSTKRGLATGIAAMGSSVGTLVSSPIAQAVIDHVSIQWALRVLGFITLAACAGSLLLIRTRVQPHHISQYNPFDVQLLRNVNFDLYLLFFLIGAMGYVIPVFLIPSYCNTLGISPSSTAGVLSVLCAMNAIGRITSGALGDKLGFITVLSSFHFLSGLMCILVWYYATSLGDMMGFAIVYGYFSGAYWGIAVPVCMHIVGLPKLGSALAIQFMMAVIPPIFAVPISERIIGDTARMKGITVTDYAAYQYLIVFAGLCGMVAGILLMIVRIRLSTRLVEKL